MERLAMRLAQVLSSIIVTVVMAGSANAQTYTQARWRNADTTHGNLYLSVEGGVACASFVGCGLAVGEPLVISPNGGADQVWTMLTEPPPGLIGLEDLITNQVAEIGNHKQMCIGFRTSQSQFVDGKNAHAITAECYSHVNWTAGQGSSFWLVSSAESVGAPSQYWGCFAIESENGLFLSVYQGNVTTGSSVVMWPLCVPNTGNCGNPSNAWHADQFWCPE